MKRAFKFSSGIAAALGWSLFATAAFGQPIGQDHASMHGMGHGGPTAMLTKQDAGSAADMDLVHDLLANNTKIKRSVTLLPNEIRTVTESDDPEVARAIKAHVASMSQRLKDGREFNIFSNTLPVLFGNQDKISSKGETTEKGAVVIQTSSDAKVIAALQAHAGEVTELVQDGMVAMRRGMMSRMAMGHGPGATMGPGFAPGHRMPASPDHNR